MQERQLKRFKSLSNTNQDRMKLPLGKWTLFFTIGVGLCFSACKKDEEEENENTDNTTTTTDNSTNTGSNTNSDAVSSTLVTATIGSKDFEGKDISAGKAFTTVLISCKNANDPDGDEDNFYIDMPIDPAAGTYTLGDNDDPNYPYQLRYFNTLELNNYNTKNGSGTITIEKITIATDGSGFMSNSKGTFSGWLYNTATGKNDSIEVKNGIFEIE